MGSNGVSPTFHFPNFAIRLDRTNYALWRNTVLSALEAFDLDALLNKTSQPPATIPASPATPSDGPPPAPLPDISNPEHAIWKKKDRLVLLWLRSTLSIPLLGSVTRATTAAEAWAILAQSFHAQSKARQMHLRRSLQTLTKGSLSILDFFEKKRSMADALAASLCEIPDDDLVAYILYELDAAYGPFRAALSMRVEPVSSDELLGLLLHEEQRLEEETQNLVLTAPPTANVATGNHSKQSSGGRSQSSNFLPT